MAECASHLGSRRRHADRVALVGGIFYNSRARQGSSCVMGLRKVLHDGGDPAQEPRGKRAFFQQQEQTHPRAVNGSASVLDPPLPPLTKAR